MLEVGRYDALCEILKGKGSIIGLVRETERVRSQIFYRTLRGSAEVIVAIFVTFLPPEGEECSWKRRG
jgi:hypothetical protein